MSELSAWQKIADQVTQGSLTLMIHREALDAAKASLQTYIHDLDLLSTPLTNVQQVSGFGGFQMGLDLADKFTQKGGGDASIKERIKDLADTAKLIQDTLEKAARAYAETDTNFADVLKNTSQQ